MFDENDPTFDHELEPVQPTFNPFLMVVGLAALIGFLFIGGALVRAYGQDVPSSSSSSSSGEACQTVLDYTTFLSKHGIAPSGHLTGDQARSFLSHLAQDYPKSGVAPEGVNELFFLRSGEVTGIAAFVGGCFLDGIVDPTTVVDKALDEAAGF